MKKTFHIIYILLSIVVFLLPAGNISVSAKDAQSFLHFKICRSDVDDNWMDNIKYIHNLQNILENNTPTRITILSAASPDGPYSLNNQLAEERSASTVSLIKRICPSLHDSIFVVKTISEDIEGTISYILNSGESWADEAVSLLRKGGKDPEEALRKYKGGIVWRYLAENVYPLLRRSEINITIGSSSDSAGLVPIVPSSESPGTQLDTSVPQNSGSANTESSGKVPGWALGVIVALAASTAVFGALYARERRRGRVPNNIHENATPSDLATSTPVSAPEPAPETAPEPVLSAEPVINHEPETAFEPETAPVAIEEPITPVVIPFVAPLAPETAQEPSFLDKVKAIILDNIADSNFGVEELATAVGISRIHLNRKLKTEADTSPSTLLKDARMKLAAQLLREGKLSISDISSMSGFSTPSYFATAFKDYYNISPSDYISQN